MPRAYENALTRRNELKTLINEAERELSRIDAFLDMYRHFDGTEQDRQTGGGDQLSEEEDGSQPQTRAFFAPVIRRVILHAGRPLPRGAIVNALADNGTPIKGRDPSNILGTMMWRMKDQFVNLEGHGYWPADVENPAIGYRGSGRAAVDVRQMAMDAITGVTTSTS